MPKVSIIMPVYNGERYLREAVDSLLIQTFPDFELIIINDGSQDHTACILGDYCDPRIRVINNEENMGMTRSLNIGLKMATGEYIARMDGDDISHPERLEKQVQFMEENRNIGLLGTSWYMIDEKGRELNIARALHGKEAIHFMCHGTVLIRMTCLKEVGSYREVFKYAQDYDLFLRLADHYEVGNLDAPLYKLRTSGNSISFQNREEQKLYASVVIEMAEEREKTGKDTLETSHGEASKVMERRISREGIGKRRMLSHSYLTWGKAALELGEVRRACYYSLIAVRLYVLNGRAWSILSRGLMQNVIPAILKRVAYRTSFFFRHQYWNRRAEDIDLQWGDQQEDYPILEHLLSEIKPKKLLDLGCGSGRLFPLFENLSVEEVVGQDISEKALQIALRRYPFSNISLTKCDVLHLKYPFLYFDLVVSNRVLQHIPPDQIERVIRKLTDLGRHIYVNEMSESDDSGQLYYLFKHDYRGLFKELDYTVLQEGLLGKQTWFLFGKKRAGH